MIRAIGSLAADSPERRLFVANLIAACGSVADAQAEWNATVRDTLRMVDDDEGMAGAEAAAITGIAIALKAKGAWRDDLVR